MKEWLVQLYNPNNTNYDKTIVVEGTFETAEAKAKALNEKLSKNKNKKELVWRVTTGY